MKGASGGKRGGRRPTSVEPDDRPRGYEATRMRELWRDIDHAKRKAGLDPAPEPVVAITRTATSLRVPPAIAGTGISSPADDRYDTPTV